MNVYLAGPITGLSYAGAVDWRLRAMDIFRDHGITAYSPMRAKTALEGMEPLGSWDYPEDGPLSGKAMYNRDLYDVRRADVVLANLLGATRVSVGTMYEMGYAKALRVPVIVAMEPDNPHKHIFVINGADLIFQSLEDSIRWISEVLTV